MIRAANHSSYPRVGDHPLDQQIRIVRRLRALGRATDADVREAEAEVISISVAEQSRAFIDVVTDGAIRWSGPLSCLADACDGLETRELVPWLDRNFYDRRVAVTGPISRRGPFLVPDLEVAQATADKPVKVTLPGPACFARLCRDEHYGDRDALADALATELAGEVRELVAAGATWFMIDEPLLALHPEDFARAGRAAATLFDAAGDPAVAFVWPGRGALTAHAAELQALPGTHVGLDLVEHAANATMIAGLPTGRGVVLGVFDAGSTVQEDAADVAATLAPHREALEARDVVVCPNAGLDLLPRDSAFDKLLHARYLVEKLTEEWTWA